MASTGSGWAQLRQQARSLETQTETLFHTYAQYASMSNIPQKPSEEEQRTEAQLQDFLERRETLLAQLSRLLDSESAVSSSAVRHSNLSRHRDILADHRRELSRLRSSIAENRARANLLSTVRSDIDAYRDANRDPGAAEADYMLDERRRIDNSHSVADGVLSQAYAVSESFANQRETLSSVNRRIVAAASQVPGINSLIGRIGSKKRRDGIILGGFIAFCFLMVLYFR
ncbi:hypothetical protein BDY21DRAFT_135728 [Lineolata rhizophorae]|uniref:Golgi SNAP receptor complex member 1 n=1 Tax=Lineolata rhizophorae TaxID=578093 RepID=A0A6A6PAP7_9PEZI|nr:hypothetical protein BDY21DRAFT_135728 [Lineolata rhizophorae]